MKKIFTLFALSLIFTSAGYAQFVSLYKVNQSGTVITGTVNNGDVLTYSTTANSETKLRFRILNTSSTNTYTYNIQRTIIANNPPLVVSGTSVSPQTYMCAGTQCYPNNVSIQSITAEMTVLPAGTNSDSESFPFLIYLDEANTLGFYVVRYKVFNTTVPNDTAVFTLKYNDYLSVNETNSVLDNVSLFPNPSNGTANISLSLKSEAPVKIQVFNSLGALIYSGAEQKLTGKNKISIDCSSYNSGLYFVVISAGETKTFKRLIINK